MVDTRSPEQTLLDRFESLDAIWPERRNYSRVATSSPAADDVVTIEPDGAGSFLLRHAWTLTGLAVIAVAFGWFFAMGAPALDARLAESTIADYDEALAAIDTSVFDARQALATLADPGADAAALSGSLEAMAPFVSATSFARATVAAPLPDSLPLVPRDRVEAVTPIRVEVATVTDQAEVVAARLGSLLTYRLLSDGLFLFPELPTAAPADDIDALSVEIAAALAASVEAVVSLPSDPLLEAHRSAANSTLALLEDLRGDYLTALRAGDEAAAGEIAAEVASSLASLDETLRLSLAAIEDWGARELDLLRVSTLEARERTR